MPKRSDRALRRSVFAMAAGACLAVAGGIIAIAASGSGDAGQRPADDPSSVGALRAEAHVFVRRESPRDVLGRVAVLRLDNPAAAGGLTELSCQRFYFAGGRGVCLTIEPGFFAAYRALLLDADLNQTATRQLAGIPSRARVSADGRYAAVTVFVSGHSYAGGSFSTQTLILDAISGEPVGDLEEFEVRRDGVLITAPDQNFWGVTFTADSNVFYATVGTGGQRYLVRGDIAQQRMEILEDNIECPSLSPDGKLLAYKRRVRSAQELAETGRPFIWQLHVLRLEDMSAVPLGTETRDIDDQVEWLDNTTVLYGVENPQTQLTDIWRTSINGGPPELYAAGSESPAVVALPPNLAAGTQ